jgi:hypothetical protein
VTLYRGVFIEVYKARSVPYLQYEAVKEKRSRGKRSSVVFTQQHTFVSLMTHIVGVLINCVCHEE